MVAGALRTCGWHFWPACAQGATRGFRHCNTRLVRVQQALLIHPGQALRGPTGVGQQPQLPMQGLQLPGCQLRQPALLPSGRAWCPCRA